EFARLVDIEDTHDRHGGPKDGPCRLPGFLLDPGRKNIPRLEAELSGHDFQSLAMGNFDCSAGKAFPQHLRHSLGVMICAHFTSPFTCGGNRVSARIAAVSAVRKETRKGRSWMHSPCLK